MNIPKEVQDNLDNIHKYYMGLIEMAINSGFYAGQAMAGVSLEDCHKNWKKYNKPVEIKVNDELQSS